MTTDNAQTMHEARHVSLAELERGLARLRPPADVGTLALIVVRCGPGQRQTPDRITLTRDGGVAGDAWARNASPDADAQSSMMRIDVARLFANGQALSIFGDNLLVDLDLSAANLPTASRLRIGDAVVEVTPKPHTGCPKFHRRVGVDALRLTADPRHRDRRLRGLYVKVIEEGEVKVGDCVEVISRR